MPDFTDFNQRLADLEFLRQKELDGDLITVTGTFSGTGVAVTFEPATGKTFFLIAARVTRVSGADFGGSVQWNCRAEVRSDAVILDRMGWSGSTEEGAGEGPGVGWGGDSHSQVAGKSLVGNSVKDFDINIGTLSTGQVGLAALYGWIEDT